MNRAMTNSLTHYLSRILIRTHMIIKVLQRRSYQKLRPAVVVRSVHATDFKKQFALRN